MNVDPNPEGIFSDYVIISENTVKVTEENIEGSCFLHFITYIVKEKNTCRHVDDTFLVCIYLYNLTCLPIAYCIINHG